MISWIQLSDLHFETSGAKSELQHRIIDAICTDIEKTETNEGLCPNALFVTGDLIKGSSHVLAAYRHKAPDFFTPHQMLSHRCIKLARDIVRAQYDTAMLATWRVARTLGIANDHVCVVPGNHDVFWPDLDPEISASIECLYNRNSSAKRKSDALIAMQYAFDPGSDATNAYCSSLFEYRRALRSNGLSHCISPGMFYSHTIPNTDSMLQVWGLNTAWACCPQTMDRAALPMALPEQIDVLASRTPSYEHDLNIALYHHPLSWSLPVERHRALTALLDHTDVGLRGHEHIDWVSPWDSTYIEIAAAAVFNASDPDIGVNYVEIDPKTWSGRVLFRHFDRRTGEIVPRTHIPFAPNGERHFKLWRSKVLSQETHARPLRRFDDGGTTRDTLHSGNAVVIAIDIADCSTHSTEIQVGLSNVLMDLADSLVSEACKIDFYSAIAPSNEGVQIAIFVDSEHVRASVLTAILQTILSVKDKLAGSLDLLYAIDYGTVSVVAGRRHASLAIIGAATQRCLTMIRRGSIREILVNRRSVYGDDYDAVYSFYDRNGIARYPRAVIEAPYGMIEFDVLRISPSDSACPDEQEEDNSIKIAWGDVERYIAHVDLAVKQVSQYFSAGLCVSFMQDGESAYRILPAGSDAVEIPECNDARRTATSQHLSLLSYASESSHFCLMHVRDKKSIFHWGPDRERSDLAARAVHVVKRDTVSHWIVGYMPLSLTNEIHSASQNAGVIVAWSGTSRERSQVMRALGSVLDNCLASRDQVTDLSQLVEAKWTLQLAGLEQ